MLRLLLTAPSPLRREEEILKITVNDPARRGDWASVFAQAPETSSKNWVRQLRAAGTYHFPENKPKTEVLLLASRQDHLVNPVCTQNIAEMWGLTAHLHPTAGHDLPLEDGAWICDEIRKWLQGIEV